MPRRTARVNELLVAECATTCRGLEITLVGELDLSNATELRSLVEPWLAAAPTASRVSIDAAGLTFTDSSGVQMLVDLQRRLRRSDRHLEVREPTRAVRQVLETLDLLSLLGVVPARGPCEEPRA